MKKPQFVVVQHYESKEDFGSDPFSYSLEIDGEHVADWGDDYHDKGSDKAIGFMEGYCFVKEIPFNEYKDVKYESRDDWEW